MNLPTRTSFLLAAPLLAAAMLCPSTSHAIVRLQGVAGVQHMFGNQGLTAGLLRAEGTVSLIPWLHLGAYGQGLFDFDGGRSGYGGGGMLALRPALPLTPIDPMGFATLGYQRLGDGRSGFTYELGAGLVYHANDFVDFEARASWVHITGADVGGFTGGVGLAFKL